jgi:hypothetical protein
MSGASLRLREHQNQSWTVELADEQSELITGLSDVAKTLESCYESVSETLTSVESGGAVHSFFSVFGIAKTLESCYESVSETLVTDLFLVFGIAKTLESWYESVSETLVTDLFLVFGIARLLGSCYQSVTKTLVIISIKSKGAVQSCYKRVGERLVEGCFCLVFVAVAYKAVWFWTGLFLSFVVICSKLLFGLFFLLVTLLGILLYVLYA